MCSLAPLLTPDVEPAGRKFLPAGLCDHSSEIASLPPVHGIIGSWRSWGYILHIYLGKAELGRAAGNDRNEALCGLHTAKVLLMWVAVRLEIYRGGASGKQDDPTSAGTPSLLGDREVPS